jgi:hypothetical protein
MIMGPPKMAPVVKLFASTPIVVNNAGAPTTTAEGMIAAGTPSSASARGHMFPAKGEDITRLQLQDAAGVFGLHVPGLDLRAAQQGSTLRGSIVTARGKTYEVKAVKPWLEGSDGTDKWQEAVLQEVQL